MWKLEEAKEGRIIKFNLTRCGVLHGIWIKPFQHMVFDQNGWRCRRVVAALDERFYCACIPQSSKFFLDCLAYYSLTLRENLGSHSVELQFLDPIRKTWNLRRTKKTLVLDCLTIFLNTFCENISVKYV